MNVRVENINRDLIEWAILRAGLVPADFYVDNPSVEKWAEGKLYPTVKQLEDFTKKVYMPFGYMFLNEPPLEEMPIPFFRSGTVNPNAESVSLNVRQTVQMMLERQDWLTQYLAETGYEDLEYVGKYNTDTSYTTIVEDIRKTLELKPDWEKNFRTWEEALIGLTNKIEEAGIIVVFNGVVGNNTYRKLSVDECRGFVLIDKKAPFLFVNAADAKAAQMFTIAHELAHIWLGKTAGFDNKNLLPADHPVELLCDQIAAELLVPEKYLKEQWEITQEFRILAKYFKVSPIVIARRAMDFNLITRKSFFSFYKEYMENWKKKKEEKGDGGNFYATARKRISLRFASFVNNAVREGNLLYRDAYRLTTLKGNTYEKFMKENLY